MDRKGIIELEGMEFHAFHGCLEEERTKGNTFVVDFRGTADLSAAAGSDRLEDTLDYGTIYRIVEKEMKQASALIENVAGRIVAAIEKEMPGFSEFSVRVSKRNPPVDGKCAWSRVTLSGGRGGKD
ncbi:MAG: dihydroneopterin aldolase [Bacteroidetes bacterium]|uniref:7,8-dihydroneopterin aldolase n=1 Tax=Candidatus Cryptobacteroides merdigallinarum TaxID=2840770 RepID=A0A9D9HF05_9BACT|nr:dihydroneopterin aldolase [Candidatus Cryptobacteroides merdigallinarum]